MFILHILSCKFYSDSIEIIQIFKHLKFKTRFSELRTWELILLNSNPAICLSNKQIKLLIQKDGNDVHDELISNSVFYLSRLNKSRIKGTIWESAFNSSLTTKGSCLFSWRRVIPIWAVKENIAFPRWWKISQVAGHQAISLIFPTLIKLVNLKKHLTLEAFAKGWFINWRWTTGLPKYSQVPIKLQLRVFWLCNWTFYNVFTTYLIFFLFFFIYKVCNDETVMTRPDVSCFFYHQ